MPIANIIDQIKYLKIQNAILGKIKVTTKAAVAELKKFSKELSLLAFIGKKGVWKSLTGDPTGKARQPFAKKPVIDFIKKQVEDQLKSFRSGMPALGLTHLQPEDTPIRYGLGRLEVPSILPDLKPPYPPMKLLSKKEQLAEYFAETSKAKTKTAPPIISKGKDFFSGVMEKVGDAKTTKGWKAVGTTMAIFGKVGAFTIQQIARGIRSLFDVMKPFSIITNLVTKIFQVFGQIIAAGFLPAVEILMAVLLDDKVMNAFWQLSGAISDTIISMFPLLQTMLPMLTALFVEVIVSMIPFIEEYMPILILAFLDLTMALIPMIPQIIILISLFITLLLKGITPILPYITIFISWLVQLAERLMPIAHILIPALILALVAFVIVGILPMIAALAPFILVAVIVVGVIATLSKAFGGLANVGVAVANLFIGIANFFIRLYNTVAGWFGWAQANELEYKEWTEPDLNIPALQFGAIATRPTLAMIAENSSPEAIVPLDKAEDFGFGAPNTDSLLEENNRLLSRLIDIIGERRAY